MFHDHKIHKLEGKAFSFVGDKLKVKESNFHSSGWSVEGREMEHGMQVSRFKREPVTYQAQLVLLGTKKENAALLDSFHDARTFDLRNRRPGKICWNDCYAGCYVTAVDPQPDERTQKVNIEIYCPYPFWIKEEVVKFYEGSAWEREYLEFPYDFPHDYKGRSAGRGRLINDSGIPCRMKLEVFGAAVDPMVYIGGHLYGVRCTLGENDTLTIDQVNGTVMKASGDWSSREVTSEFNNRTKEESVFDPVPAGISDVTWSGAFNFEITLYKERDEAEWTE